ncbi:MAG: hypothetical protein ACP5NW_03845, partial [Candidatus Woesearchaeota archaeon]
MNFIDVIDCIESSDEFKIFIDKNPHYYLVHVFRIIDNDNLGNWQIGYYSKDTDKIVVFEYNNDLVMMHAPEDALKKEEYINRLDLGALKIREDDVLRICEDTLKDEYPKEIANKRIILLQNLPEFGQVWNITIVTLAFSIINVKVGADSGNV